MKKKYSYVLTGLGSVLTVPNLAIAAAPGCFDTVFGKQACSYEDWIKLVWPWALSIAVSLSIVMVAAAGMVWMTSAGNPDRITTAKKMITGALSGLALLVLARVFLVSILGLPWGF